MMRHFFKRLWARLTRRKSYQHTVMDEHPIAFYLLGNEDFIEDEEKP